MMLSGGIICGRGRALDGRAGGEGGGVGGRAGGEGGGVERRKTLIQKTPDSVKRDIISCKKRPTIVSKETC
jgi:hypothetical protein